MEVAVNSKWEDGAAGPPPARRPPPPSSLSLEMVPLFYHGVETSHVLHLPATPLLEGRESCSHLHSAFLNSEPRPKFSPSPGARSLMVGVFNDAPENLDGEPREWL